MNLPFLNPSLLRTTGKGTSPTDSGEALLLVKEWRQELQEQESSPGVSQVPLSKPGGCSF